MTQNGADLLLPAEENCANMIEPPNELEVIRAFTRKMNHLLCVMKVIHRFKSILARHRANSRPSSGTPNQTQGAFDASEERAKAEVIEALLSQRRKAQAQKIVAEDNEAPPARDDKEEGMPFLGIGTGARDDFAKDEATPDLVSDSPTAVDFNVYDRAYESAIESITSGQADSSRRPTVYLTKFVKDAKNIKGVPELVEGVDAPKDEDRQASSSSTGTITQLTSKLDVSDAK